jgi:pimeloyl-ACP methyl ester carboxylesterase
MKQDQLFDGKNGSFHLVQQPVLVLYGETSDTFLPSAVRRFQSKLPHAKITCFQNTSHFVPMEKPAETALAIRFFIANHSLL